MRRNHVAYALLLALIFPLTSLQASAQSTAETILKEAGFQGGLVVQVDCDRADLLLALSAQSNVLAHALVTDANRLEAVRDQIRDSELYGRVSAELWKAPVLPYADGMVNVVVVSDKLALSLREEISRVLAPNGVAFTIDDHPAVVDSVRKPRLAETDDWTHARYNATGNAVSRDQGAGPPRYMQWAASPRWNRGVKTSNLISSEGRLFYILDDSHFAVSEHGWSLLARDASNGVLLWRRNLSGWYGSQGGKKVGPAQANRRLVAGKDIVIATLKDDAPISVLDAATGKTLHHLKRTTNAAEFILSAGVLVVLVDPNTPADIRRGQTKSMRLVAVVPDSGEVLWEHPEKLVLPLTVASDGQQVVYHDGTAIRSRDLRTGKERWTSPPTGQKIVYHDKFHPDKPGAEKSTIILAPQLAPTLIMYQDVVAFAGGRQLNVISASDGYELWRSEYAATNYSAPVDLFGFDGALWGPNISMNLWRPLDDDLGYHAYDPLTGTIKKTVSGKYGFSFQHHRCHQMKVVGNTVIAARAGIEFLDCNTGEVTAQHWTRGSCYYGVLPANGRLYVPPHNCACYVRAKLSGFMALNSNAPAKANVIPDDQRLTRGPAYGQLSQLSSTAAATDWPTYRHDVARSGRTNTKVGTEMLLGWDSEPGGQLTSPVVADGRLYLASTNAHTLHVLDAATGKPLWQYTFAARVDSPPTIDRGLVLCGCRDGSVHALRATDGALVWRFTACPEERRIVSRGQLESVWPVHGSVLVLDDVAYFAAGRSSYLDGGLHLYGLKLPSGEKVVDKVLATRHSDGSESLDEQGVDGYLNDILSSNGNRLFMRHLGLDLQGNPQAERIAHLHGADGFLSGESTDRLTWAYAPLFTSPHQGAFYDVRLSRFFFPSGRILAEDDDTIYGYGQSHYDKPTTDTGGQWALFAAEKKIDVSLDLTAREYRAVAMRGEKPVRYRWWKKLPIRVRAMVRTDDVLFVAGPQGSSLTTQAALDGKAPATLLAVNPEDGEILAEMSLPSTPVFDGMIAAGDNLYVALANGQVFGLWSIESGRPGKPLSAAAWSELLPPVKVAEEPGLVGRWRFDEGAGMAARDCSGRGHDAQITGRWVKGDFGNCLAAEGVAGAVVIPDAPQLHFGNESFSIAWWVKVDGSNARLLGKESFPENWWVINLKENGAAELVLGEGRGAGKAIRLSTDKPLDTKAWTHLAAVVDRQTKEIRWYVNGKPSGQQSIPETMTAGLHGGDADISIPSRHLPFRGLIGDLRIYQQALTAARVQQLYEEQAKQRSSVEVHED